MKFVEVVCIEEQTSSWSANLKQFVLLDTARSLTTPRCMMLNEVFPYDLALTAKSGKF